MWNSAETLIRLFLIISLTVAVVALVSLVLPFPIKNVIIGSGVIIVASYILAFRSWFLTKAEKRQTEQKIAQLEKKAKRKLPVKNGDGKTHYLSLEQPPEEE